MTEALTQSEAYYFRAVLRRLHEMRSAIDDAVVDEGGAGVSMIGCEALSDEIDWLDGWISERTAALAAHEQGSGKEA